MDVYDRLGVRKVISCYGTWTNCGGALMDPRVLDAMCEAARVHVNMNELHEKAGQRVAELIGVEAACITDGAAAGIFLATAAVMAGNDPAKLRRLPDTTGMKNEVIICKCQRFTFDQGVRTAGGTLVEIGDGHATRVWEMEAAINDKTAACLFVVEHNEDAALPFPMFRDIAKAHGLPVIVDTAAEVPPVSNLKLYSDLGADLVIFSGGKGIRGPQASGLILGRRDLIEACHANTSPHEFIGRIAKVGKEEIIGLVTALELYINEISKRERELWEKMVGYIVDHLQGIPHVKVWRQFPYYPTRDVPIVVVELEDGAGLSPSQVLEQLLAKDPPIYTWAPKSGFGYARGKGFILNPHTMIEGEEVVVAEQLREIFQARG